MVSTGMMDKKMETTMVFLGLYWDTGKEDGNYYLGFRAPKLGPKFWIVSWDM